MKLNDKEENFLLNDKGRDKFYLVELIRRQQNQGELGIMPMIIINGEPIYYHNKEEKLPIDVKKSDIKSIKIINAEKCINVFGYACKYGLITITTYGKQESLP